MIIKFNNFTIAFYASINIAAVIRQLQTTYKMNATVLVLNIII